MWCLGVIFTFALTAASKCIAVSSWTSAVCSRVVLRACPLLQRMKPLSESPANFKSLGDVPGSVILFHFDSIT